MPEKVRVNLVISKRNHDLLKEISERVPKLTMSGIVDELLSDGVPMLKAMLDKADELPSFKDDEEAQEEYMAHVVAQRVVEKMFGTQEEFIHTLMKLGGALREGSK